MSGGGAALLVLLLLAAPAAGNGAAAGVAAEDALPPQGPTVEERLAEIRRRIQAAVEYPRVARSRGLEGVATVGFVIDRGSGLAREIRLVASSGHPSLDRAARSSVVRAGALPWVYGRLEVPVRFDLEAERSARRARPVAPPPARPAPAAHAAVAPR